MSQSTYNVWNFSAFLPSYTTIALVNKLSLHANEEPYCVGAPVD